MNQRKLKVTKEVEELMLILLTRCMAGFNSLNIRLFSEHQSIPFDNNALGIYRENDGDIAQLKIVRYIVAVLACL